MPVTVLTKDIIAWFGGYEMVMAIGGMLRAAELRMIILVDGFIMTNCILAAYKTSSGSFVVCHIRTSGR